MPTKGSTDEGRIRLRLLIDAAQRYHDGSARSKRKSQRHPVSQRGDGDGSGNCSSGTTTASSSASSVSAATGALPPDDEAVQPLPGSEPWDCVRWHLDHFWDADPGDADAKYASAKHWLTSMFLWDVDRSWQDCEGATPESAMHAISHRQAARLEQLPRGHLFFAN